MLNQFEPKLGNAVSHIFEPSYEYTRCLLYTSFTERGLSYENRQKFAGLGKGNRAPRQRKARLYGCLLYTSSGKTLIVRGNYTYDKYEHDYVLLPYDVLQVERMPRHDDAPEGQKRVELHLHTKSSSMDGFCDSGKIVRRALSLIHI